MLVKQERWTHRNHLDGNNSLKDEPKETYTDFFCQTLTAEEKPPPSNLALPQI